MKNLKFINKIIKTDETGRSMVEMLGVLAIVGVISIGGIAGYIYGMNRYRTNEILDGGNKRAVLVASQLASGITPNLTEFVDYDETAGGTFSSDVIRWENEFGIQVSGVKKEVCENLIRMIGDNTPLRGIVNVDGEDEEDLNPGECADGTNNNLYLVYNLEMLSKGAVDSGDRTGEKDPSTGGLYYCNGSAVVKVSDDWTTDLESYACATGCSGIDEPRHFATAAAAREASGCLRSDPNAGKEFFACAGDPDNPTIKVIWDSDYNAVQNCPAGSECGGDDGYYTNLAEAVAAMCK